MIPHTTLWSLAHRLRIENKTNWRAAPKNPMAMAMIQNLSSQSPQPASHDILPTPRPDNDIHRRISAQVADLTTLTTPRP
mmetsp:Transcript_1910/g.3426  ORF Transcript_1910/g.3426 Transcript_1910/m.3426 type:complete len:80 (-) Transcript_1910:45-284(-)|eukprot:CAMPEP_0201874312 /NCGR_PEP_ID=MMETSP0902-20130614/6611_1 /ASSEMBLY_ACC=CAM_ASM_000551 /TAXON_ID=420261 /ORGANISM="Thalassiosira antarctica, Strain CCMP982" /LENGTH=79 /DNA_ID=CAMNT_0048401157 /DNA_START=212 /DNA_END=451 /DNA_ORIENTATION=+